MHCPKCGFENHASLKACGKCGSLSFSAERRKAVLAARDSWVAKLVDLSRQNRLLYFRDLKTGTLGLSNDDPAIMGALMSGKSVPLVRFCPNIDETSALARANAIRRTAISNRDERGLETLFIAFGFATWPAADKGLAPQAPILFIPVAFEKAGREGRGLSLRLAGDVQINPVLLFALEREHGRQINPDTLMGAREANDDPPAVFTRLGKVAAGIEGFAINPRCVLGNFVYQKMAMVRDLKENLDQLTMHDLVAAIAGDSAAQQSLRSTYSGENPKTFDQIPPDNEFLMLDADSSQQTAIAGALSLSNGVIHGPPGTGKSQTIANLIVELAARGHRVLFVAEKRAALDVVLSRLERRDLGHLALDLHGAGITRCAVMKQFAESLERIRESPLIDVEQLHRQFVDHRKRLNDHAARIHRRQSPSDLTVYQLQGRLLHFGDDQRSKTRWRGLDLDRLNPQAIDDGHALFTELQGFSDLFFGTAPSPWTGAKLADGAAVRLALDGVGRLNRDFWPALRKSLATAIDTSGASFPASLEELLSLLALLNGINQTVGRFGSEIFELDLEKLKVVLGPARSRFSASLAWCLKKEFRHALKQVKPFRRTSEKSSAKLLEAVNMAAGQIRHWRALGMKARPSAAQNLDECRTALTQTMAEIDILTPIMARGNLRGHSIEALERLISMLAEDERTPHRLPRLAQIEAGISRLGLDALKQEIRERRTMPANWDKLLEHAWQASLLDRALAQEPNLGGFVGDTHQRFRDQFCHLDEERLNLSVQRVQRAYAGRARSSMNAHPDQESLIRHESAKKARHLPFRRLLESAPDVLTALRPCWLASPLSVSELMPAARQYFDMVLFDEASQVLPEDAVPALLRAKIAIVAGDQNQLPPTTFFDVSGAEDEETESASDVEGFESLLDQMIALIDKPWSLDWHYRSQDESLIAFSNQHIYGNRLITFPSTGAQSAISQVLVPFTLGQDGQEESSSGEVRRVVELVVKHATERPGETLGVIAMGIKHARKIEAALDLALISRPDLAPFFADDCEERFFVKNLERVQGDERDAIILTIGYGKDRSGKLSHNFGPLNRKGCERRLNVAITRARKRMTVASSFDHRDVDPDRTKARGVELLRLYLEYAASGGKRLGDQGQQAFAENSFEADVQRMLQAKGIELIPQYGVSKYRIDFVAKHPKRPGRLVLAVECDGATYHSAYTARDRDRLRQQHLEALGWRFHRIWSTDWFMRRDQEIDRVVAAYKAAVMHADRSDSLQAQADANSEVQSENSRNPAPSITAAPSVNRRKPRPAIPTKNSIDEYHPGELLALIDWIESDGHMRTDQELMNEMIKTLGFKRRGMRIEEAIKKAIRQKDWRAKSLGVNAGR